jgi:hypothetical protein
LQTTRTSNWWRHIDRKTSSPNVYFHNSNWNGKPT